MPRLGLLALFVSVSSFAQTTASPNVAKDSAAVSIAQRSLAAMGGASLGAYQDITASGTITAAAGSSPAATYPIVIKAKGTHELRTEISKPSGLQVWATDSNSGCMTHGQVSRPVAFQNLLAQRVDFFPLLTLLSEYAGSNMNVQNAGTATVSGRPVYVIALSFTPANLSMTGVQTASFTQRIFYIDQQSYLVLKMQSIHYADNSPENGIPSEMYYSNYQAVNGLLLPTKIDSYFDSHLTSSLSLAAISLNSGLLDSQFTVTCGGSYAN